MTPRSTEQNQALRDSSRERILMAAIRLFSRHGYDATSVRQIAIEAKLAQGLMYSHFRGKEDLLKALFRKSMEDVRASFAGEPKGSKAPPLETLVRASLAILKRNLDFWRLSYSVRMQESVVKALGPDLQAWTREILRALEAIFRSAGSKQPAIDAALFFAAFDGLCQHYVLDPARYPLDKVSQALIARFTPTPSKGPAHGKSRRNA
jgi:AcrR family transcriptional regulator